eukprot:5204368-Alexandrium_andersonii.AAC.1
MSASLVGSEMCIRDRSLRVRDPRPPLSGGRMVGRRQRRHAASDGGIRPLSSSCIASTGSARMRSAFGGTAGR